MTTPEIRAAFFKFYSDRQHALIPRALLVPQNDATTLFTGSGMQPLLPYLLGADHPSGKRLVDSQTCFRAEDIDEVGDNRHTTFFEMLGNWSLGEYFKAEQLLWFFEFLTEIVGLDPEKLYVTAFMGDPKNNIPRDEEAASIWADLFAAKNIKALSGVIGAEAHGYKRGMKPGERIFFYDAKKNWWSRAGVPENMPAGEPGGPDSEVFYRFDDSEHTDDEKQSWGEQCHPNCDCGRFMEIGNSVFMQYVKRADGGFEKLQQFNVDFGGGLERIAAAANNDGDIFKISFLWPIIEQLEELSGYEYNQNSAAMRVIADHLRAATFLAVDGVVPSNTQQGYVLRRLVRRAIRQAHTLDLKDDFLEQIVPIITRLYRQDFPEVSEREQTVIDVLVAEETKFRRTLEKGIKEFDKLAGAQLTGELAFKLSDTYGFPAELSLEEAHDRGMAIDENWRHDFDRLLAEQKVRSRTATSGQFKGGLADHSEASTKYHTATHLMYQALRDVLGDHVVQRGSNITPERLRFDFSHDQKVTPDELAQVEAIVNTQIDADLTVTWEEYPTRVAIDEKGALGQFGDRYGDVVKVYRMQQSGSDRPFSFEICGGPHVEHTAQLAEGTKRFKIKKEESSSAGVRRIKAVLE
jgi:alanyl-tRNA synthetase